MTKLLTDQDFAEIRANLKDVTDTFLTKDVTYRLFQESMTRMNSDSNKNATYEDFILQSLVIHASNPPLESRQGIADLGEDYLLFSMDVLLAAVNDNEAVLFGEDGAMLMTGPQDRLVIDGEEMLVDSVTPIGPLNGTEVLVKVIFKKQLPVA